MRKLVLAAVPLLAAAALAGGCGGKNDFSFSVSDVINYTNPMTTIMPGGMAIIVLDTGDGMYPTTAASYTVYFRDQVDGTYSPDTMDGGAPTLGTMFTDNGDGTFELVVTIPVSACGGPMYVTVDRYAAPPFAVPLPSCP
jgi:hypothetical protein